MTSSMQDEKLHSDKAFALMIVIFPKRPSTSVLSMPGKRECSAGSGWATSLLHVKTSTLLSVIYVNRGEQ